MSRSAIVTGGSRGIGLAIAKVLADEGFALTLVARNEQVLEQSSYMLKEAGHNVQHISADVTDENMVKKIVASHKDAYGGLDTLVNNAGIGVVGNLIDLPTKLLDRQINLNLRSLIIFYREALPLLKEAGERHHGAWVINVASLSGKQGHARLSVYSATKNGVLGFSESMNKELAEFGIRTCALCPGLVNTEMTDYAKDRVPPETMVQPEDIASAVRFVHGLSPSCLVPEIQFTRPGSSF